VAGEGGNQRLRRAAPEVVEDHVIAVPYLAGERLRQLGVRSVEADRGVSAEASQRRQRLRVSSGADDASGPRYLATWTASYPATPVAPRTSTVSPGSSLARHSNASHDDIAGFGRAAADSSSTASGIGRKYARGTTVCSAIVP
jgi:hypothetical protein